MKYDRAIHSPGIKVTASNSVRAQMSVKILHLDFIFHSKEKRQETRARFDAAGQPKSVADFFNTPIDDHDWRVARYNMIEEIYAKWLNQYHIAKPRTAY